MSKRPSKTDRHPSVTESGDADTFLSRWARRKRVARGGADPDARISDESLEGDTLARAAPSVGKAPSQGEDSQPVELTDEDMPPLDAIDENTDMSGFFSPKVSQAVKKAALKKFFHSPAFNIVDGLDDYDDDFTAFAALGDIVTSDMRGQMEHQAERARENLAKDGRAEEAAPSAEAAAERTDDSDAAPESIDEEPVPGKSEQAASDAPGITRDPGRQAKAGPGKLRPRGAADNDT